MNPDEQNTAAPAPPAGIQAIDAAIEQTEYHRRQLRIEQEQGLSTVNRTERAMADLEQRTDELLQARGILQRAHEPTVAAADELRETEIRRQRFPLDGDGYRQEPVDAAMYEAWAIIANAGGGNWQATQDDGWMAAARRWRDRYGFGPTSADGTT
jgi:hypothetical protein